VLNKPNEGLMCGFKPIPNSAKLLNEHGKPFRRAENPPSEIGEIIHRYCPPGGLVIDPFCGTAPVAEQTMRQGKRVLLLDRDQMVMKAAEVRHQQRYTYLQRAGLLPKFYTADERSTETRAPGRSRPSGMRWRGTGWKTSRRGDWMTAQSRSTTCRTFLASIPG
jgi:hypothetical protein